jgi:NADH-quinone oxidoreductase subunit J
MFQTILFYLFAIVLILAALRVITEKNAVHAVLYLVLCFFNSAVLWMLIEVEFLAITLVLVYVGAVMVLFLFVVMMLEVNLAATKEGYAKYLPVALLVAGVIVVELGLVLVGGKFSEMTLANAPAITADGVGNTQFLGEQMYTNYLYPFELAAVILLIAMVAAITLTHRRRPNSKYIDPAVQISRQPEGRVVMHDIKPSDFSVPEVKDVEEAASTNEKDS